MLERYQDLNQTQKNTFSDVANKLLANTFLCRDKKDNKENYYFLLSFKELFDDFFDILGYEVIIDSNLGTAYITSDRVQNTLKLKRDDTIILLILRLLYNERMKETSLNENIIISVDDIHERYNYLEIKKRINKTDLVSALRLFRRYNLIEVIGDVTVGNTKIVLLPTLLCAIKTEDINEVYQTISKILSEVGE